MGIVNLHARVQSDIRSWDEYEATVRYKITEKNTLAWDIGDLFNIGDERFHDTYMQAFDETQVSFRTLQNYANVCRAFPASRRKWRLSFSHYDTVKALPEDQQDALLSEAASNQLNRDELRQRVREVKAEPEPQRVQMECKVRDIIKELCYRHGFDLGDTVRISATVLDSIMEAAA